MNDKQLTIKRYFDVYNYLKEARDRYFAVIERVSKRLHEIGDNTISEAQAVIDNINRRQSHLAKLDFFENLATKELDESERVYPKDESPYDKEKLVKLFLKMNGVKNNKFAKELFTEIYRQKNAIYKETDEQSKDVKNKPNADEEIESLKKEKIDSVSIIKTSYDLKGQPFCDELISFYYNNDREEYADIFDGSIMVGSVEYIFPTCLVKNDNNEFDPATDYPLEGAVDLNVLGNQVLLAQYNNDNENVLLDSIAMTIVRTISYLKENIDAILYIDPVRFNESGLGVLGSIAGANGSLLERAPHNQDEVRNRLNKLINQKQHSRGKTTLLILHNFPHGYDGQTINLIQQLVANAESYDVCLFVTSNISNSASFNKDAVEYIRSRATAIDYSDRGWTMKLNDYGFEMPFYWLDMDKVAVLSCVHNIESNKVEVNMSNIFEERVPLSINAHLKKGSRLIENNPYSIDNQGNILKLDFESSNFATFLCGASRSGKSNLLHIIITDLLNNNHPDDIEIWLIDFKMTEFSRYTKNTPPHIRYILLDESPELVYDIVDRLTDILNKRQNIFKGKWDKLSNVPKDKYMPALFVIIDEFSVMSKIIADSIVNANDNYIAKMQTLLAKGAALGMRFIFASQGFTSGSRGLSDFAKKQIQQRIAMKTDLSEIKATLDLTSYSEKDKRLMEELEVYHSLYKSAKELNYDGDHLILGKVLYISNVDYQKKFIEQINNYYQPVERFEPDNDVSFIYKKPLVVDGNAYTSFEKRIKEMRSVIGSDVEDKCLLFLGEPRRMMTTYPIDVYNSYQENVAILSYLNEKNSAASVILSIMKSLDLQNKEFKCFSPVGNQLFGFVKPYLSKNNKQFFSSLDDICEQLKTIKTLIQNREASDCYYFIFGIEKLFFDFSFIKNDFKEDTPIKEDTYDKRQEGEMDLLTMMEMGMEVTNVVETPLVKVESKITVKKVYDAREDFKFILTNGPRLGIHFIVPLETIGALSQIKLDDKLFKHKVFFRSAKADAINVVSGKFTSDISELPDHILRYCDNINAVSYRPYLHEGIEIDGHLIDENGEIIIKEEDDYLL